MANVFGALNRFISRLDADPNAPTGQSPGRIQTNPRPAAGYGFQVLRNTNSTLALEPWFDFIVGINGRTLDSSDPNLFSTEVRNCAGASVSIGVFSAKGQVIREQYLSVPADASSLGLSLQWSPLALTADVWHILDVMPNSPADVAGLLPYSDYVIGSPDSAVLHGEASLGELVERYIGRPLRLHVYNTEYDVTRLLTITPAKDWGGEGALGCVLAYGALHRVPAPLTEPAEAPGETLFESGNTNITTNPIPSSTAAPADFLVPANMSFPTQPTSPPPPTSTSPAPTPPNGPPTTRTKKARAHHAVNSTTAGLDDYFAEGEQKSREIDRAPTPKTTGNLPPPPPKAGGRGPPVKTSGPAAPVAESES
ncbi:Hypothetical protein R9X50_00278000 [Acrodontium crateriforme]|uniref:PDZ GRASP-type domain-containing protein n=1 Tax=Acrodontium crateriforme TaxID=150365 RepID=A0AAQ3M273_9PEZI|nr:Hypothetical protein R9X50_00278000 [Acrodontium crateriforme]